MEIFNYKLNNNLFYKKTKKRIYEVLEEDLPDDNLARGIQIVIISLIGLNMAAMIIKSYKPLYYLYPKAFDIFEVITLVIFTVEYLLRLWVCTESPYFKNRFQYFFSAMSVIDLMAILPSYLNSHGYDLLGIRIIRIARLFRIAKLLRYSKSLRTIGKIFMEKKEELISSLFIMFVILLVASSLLYYAERDVQPDKFPSIPHAMWWGIATLTTVGYGDIYPISAIGKVMSSIIAILAIGICALPTGIISAGFVENIQNNKKSRICPHCGKEISE